MLRQCIGVCMPLLRVLLGRFLFQAALLVSVQAVPVKMLMKDFIPQNSFSLSNNDS